MDIPTKAKILFGVGCFIGLAGLAQVYMVMGTGRLGMSAIGSICVGVAFYCCVINWNLWHGGSK